MVVPRARGGAGDDDDEVTQTETQTGAVPDNGDPAIPELPPLDGDLSPEEQATLATTRALREFRPPPARNGNGAAPDPAEMIALGRNMERPSLWRGVAVVLVVAGVAILAAVFKALQSAPSY